MAQGPEEILQSFLSDPDALNSIGEILGALGGGGDEGEKETKDDSSAPFDNMDFIFKIGQIMSSLSCGDDNETRLIEALKPYLSKRRSESADKAIKLLKLSKMAPLLGEMNIF